MSARRFTDKPDLNPQAVRALPDGHGALVANRTLFPSTVVEVTATTPDRILVSGANNRKIGATVEKGKFRGWDVLMLSLEERATCPESCEARAFCYGNGMQLARRHRIGDAEVFYDRLGEEIAALAIKAEERGAGVLIRLHVLGDFPSTEYVAFWADVLNEWENVACYGYTHWPRDSEIGAAIDSLKSRWRARFRIRWSGPAPEIDGAVIIDFIPQKPVHDDIIVCPAQTDANACCATCALCWAMDAAGKTIAFIKHGPKSGAAEFEAIVGDKAAGPQGDVEGAGNSEDDDASLLVPDARNIAPLPLGGLKPARIPDQTPEVALVRPEDLIVEDAYQRNLSPASLRLIRQIVENWDWMHFKPPIIAEWDGAYFVIDGQHTAIAAATHPDIETIPCIFVQGRAEKARALAFVAQNTQRVAVTPYDIYHAERAAGVNKASEFERFIAAKDYAVPRRAPGRGGEPFTIEGVVAARAMFGSNRERFGALLDLAAAAGGAVITRHLINVWQALNEQAIWQPLDIDEIAQRLALFENFDVDARTYARATEQTRTRAGCILLTRRPEEQETI